PTARRGRPARAGAPLPREGHGPAAEPVPVVGPGRPAARAGAGVRRPRPARRVVRHARARIDGAHPRVYRPRLSGVVRVRRSQKEHMSKVSTAALSWLGFGPRKTPALTDLNDDALVQA